MNKIFNSKDYIIVPLVGNKYCKKKPSNSDKIIALVPEDNKYDKNAIKVISLRNGKQIKLGYIIKNRALFIKNMLNSLKFITFLTKKDKSENKLYYYLVLFKL